MGSLKELTVYGKAVDSSQAYGQHIAFIFKLNILDRKEEKQSSILKKYTSLQREEKNYIFYTILSTLSSV